MSLDAELTRAQVDRLEGPVVLEFGGAVVRALPGAGAQAGRAA